MTVEVYLHPEHFDVMRHILDMVQRFGKVAQNNQNLNDEQLSRIEGKVEKLMSDLSKLMEVEAGLAVELAGISSNVTEVLVRLQKTAEAIAANSGDQEAVDVLVAKFATDLQTAHNIAANLATVVAPVVAAAPVEVAPVEVAAAPVEVAPATETPAV